jgi:CubicO group peptidase (beta-lactamase class C family)
MTAVDDELARDLRRAAVETFNERTLAGLAAGLVVDGELGWSVGLGFADAARGRAVEPTTVFRIGSISKTMTALAVLQLVEAGSVRLDDPAVAHLRSIRLDADEQPTIRQLLTHTGGIGELRRWSDLLRPTIGLAAGLGQVPPLARYYAPELRVEVRPGSKWAYANHGVAALGQLVEDVTGEPFAERLRTRVFEPLGMHGTDVLRSERVRDRLAVGYALRRGRLRAVKDREIVVAPAGSVFSSLEDMARYAAAIAGGGANAYGRVVDAETLEQMLRPQWPPGEVPAMGLAFMLDRLDTRVVAGHDGGWPGFVSSLLVDPESGAGALAFTNTSVSFAPHDLAERMLRLALGLAEREEREPVPESPHLWPELVGIYKPPRGLNTNFRLLPVTAGEVQVAVRKGRLTVSAPSPVPALRRGIALEAADADDPFVFLARVGGVEVPVRFGRGRSGAVDEVRAGSGRGGFVRLVRRPRLTSVGLWARAGAGAGAVGITAALAGRRVRRRAKEVG